MPSQGNVEVNGVARPIKVLQITDMHLFENAADGLGGIVTDRSFDAVWGQVMSRHRDADVIVSTGDIAQESCLAVYRSAAARLREPAMPVLALPGNHDCVETMFAEDLWDNSKVPARYDRGAWTFVLLNSAVPQCVHGQLGHEQLAWLSQELRDIKRAGRYGLVCLHHHPVYVGSLWLDRLGLHDADEFWNVVEPFSDAVRGVLWGHVHQAYDQWRGHTRLMATPSTGFQFCAKRDEFRLDEVSPGYRWLLLYPDGHIETMVERLESDDFMPDVSFSGY